MVATTGSTRVFEDVEYGCIEALERTSLSVRQRRAHWDACDKNECEGWVRDRCGTEEDYLPL